METGEFFTAEEKRLLFVLYRKLLQLSGETLHKGDCRKLKTHLVNSIQNNRIQRDIFGLNPIIKDMQTAVIVAEEIGMRRASILGLMLHDSVRCGTCTAEEVERNYGEDVAGIIRGLIRVNELYLCNQRYNKPSDSNHSCHCQRDVCADLVNPLMEQPILKQVHLR